MIGSDLREHGPDWTQRVTWMDADTAALGYPDTM